MNLTENFEQESFLDWAAEFLPDFRRDIRKVDVPNSFSGVNAIQTLGESNLGVRLYAIAIDSDPAKRKVGLANESFSLLKNYGTPNAIIAYYSPNSPQWRLSLLTSTPTWDDGKIITKLSNPKRQSYVLGQKAKVKTPQKFIIAKGRVFDFTDLKSRFSVEVVNKEFYQEISGAFTKLVGGTTTKGKTKTTHEALLHLPSVVDTSQTSLEFAVRLIGRIIFCWFLREKRSEFGLALMPKELLSDKATDEHQDYYHKILEPIFFEILNKPIKSRRDEFAIEPFSTIPYLNGGLFSPQEDDYYKLLNGDLQSRFHNTLIIPDRWFKDLFEVLETYNFTIDENTSFDEELSIDPEMLGRIFENLLAEINPETGESARKSTGSYYTPRVIVDYMVDESLCLYLKEKTSVDEEKLRPLISYDLEDDRLNQLSDDDRGKIADALSAVKILDPACGSGAFPIGALQKIVFMLQQIDPHGQLWFKKQIQNTPIELRRVIEREFQEKNFDYLRKLGIIRENIYGVDIQPIATEISRLRCFLTLVVDERIDETLENRGIEPLPNLDFKFVTANTLIGLPSTGKSVNQMGLFEDDEGIKELREVREMFFNASGAERDSLKLQFVQTQNRMFQKLIADNLRGHADLTAKLTTWDPFSHKSSDWFDPEWMFGIKEGFDIVIANPPYLTLSLGKGQIVSQELVTILTGIYSEIKEYKNNLFAFFIRRSFDLLDLKGNLTFIVPNVFLYNKNFSKIRKYILDHSDLNILLDIKGAVFESAVIGGNCIFLLSRCDPNKEQGVKTAVIKNNTQFSEINYQAVLTSEIKKTPNSKFYLDPVLYSLMRKLSDGSASLDEIASLYNGIKTGNNDKYLSNCSLSSSYKPVARGRDIIKYAPIITETYVLFDKSKLWSNTNEVLLGKHPKILVRQTGDSIIATLDNSGIYHMDTTHSIFDPKFDLKYILGILNSKLITWWHKNFTSEDDRAFAEVKIVNLKMIPIKLDESPEQQHIIEIVDDIFAVTKSEDYLTNEAKLQLVRDYERQIDQIIYKLYNLSPDEIETIEKSTK